MDALNQAYDAGFAAAARWAMRMYLCSNMDSPDYMATRERAVSRIASMCNSPDGRPEDGPGGYTRDYRAGLADCHAANDRKAERGWINHPNTIEAKRQWDSVADVLGADRDCQDSVLAAAKAMRADAERWRFLLRNRLLSIDGRVIAGIDLEASSELVEKAVARMIESEGLGEGVK